MKKSIVLVCMLASIALFAFSQNNSITLEVGEVRVKNMKPGDDIRVPVILSEKSGGLLAAFQLFIGFDHSLLTWKGTWENPMPGIININENTPYNETSWVINDNGSQMVAVWDDPNFNGIDMKNGDIFFEVVFTYKGGLAEGASSPMVWGDYYEDVEGKLMKGKTEIYDENLLNFNLTFINGGLKN
jgi:hypothetical protein